VSNEAAKQSVEVLGVANYCSKSKWKAEVRDVRKTPAVDDVVQSQEYPKPTETESSAELTGVRHDKNRSVKGKRRKVKGDSDRVYRIMKERSDVLQRLSDYDKENQ